MSAYEEPANSPQNWSAWKRFWHAPLRAERLAITRIFLATALLTDLLIQFLPHLSMFFGPGGTAPSGLYEEWALENWRWSALIFATDDMTVVTALFWAYVCVTLLLLVGWQTRLMNVAVWFFTFMFYTRNPIIRNGADDMLIVGVFLLMFAPSGRVFSLDRLFGRRRGDEPSAEQACLAPAWPVRLLQIQLCMVYLATGLVKLAGIFNEGHWWFGSAVHYALNDMTMSRWSYAQLAPPYWLVVIATCSTVWWEVSFWLLVMFRKTRKWALLFGVLVHVGIWLFIEVGWFSFYTLSFYGLWIPPAFWDRFGRKKEK